MGDMMDSGNGIQKRAADEDVYDLGSKLHEKLEHKKEHMEEMYGNMTCMLRECQVLDSENKFYPEGIKMEWDEMKNKIEDDWLRSQLEKYCDQCIEFAENLPPRGRCRRRCRCPRAPARWSRPRCT